MISETVPVIDSCITLFKSECHVLFIFLLVLLNLHLSFLSIISNINVGITPVRPMVLKRALLAYSTRILWASIERRQHSCSCPVRWYRRRFAQKTGSPSAPYLVRRTLMACSRTWVQLSQKAHPRKVCVRFTFLSPSCTQ